MKSNSRTLVCCGVAAAFLVSCTGERRFASIGTAGTGGIYYPLGGALARMLSAALPGTTFTAEVTGGSVENLNRVAGGEMDLGMAMGTSLAKAIAADADRFAGIRVVAPLYPNVAHILVAAGSSLTDLSEAAGMRVSVGTAGSGTEEMSRDLLDAHGLELDGIQARYLSFSESSSALRDRAIEAAILSVGYPAAAVLEATTAAGVGLIGIAPRRLQILIERYPYYRASVVPAGVYPGVDEDLPTAAVMNWLFASETLDGRIVDTLLEILATRGTELRQVNDIAAQIDLSALDHAPLPLHPAAAAWLAAR